MANDVSPDMAYDEWADFVAEMNEQLFETLEASTQAQAELFESLFDGVDAVDEDHLSEGMESYARAYEVWMDAAEESVEEVSAVAESGEVSPNEFRDLWLDAANDAFKEVMETEAFASMTGQFAEDMMDVRQNVDETAQGTLSELGFATERDVREIGERIAEFERRQNRVERTLDDVETKLDRVLEHLEGEP